MGTLTAGIKEIFSSAKTTGSNVMLCANDGTPDGHVTMSNLVSVLGSTFTNITSGMDLDNCTNIGIYISQSGAISQSLSNCPVSTAFYMLSVYGHASTIVYQILIQISQTSSATYIRQCGVSDSSFTRDWHKYNSDIPDFYKDYSTLASLITGVGGIRSKRLVGSSDDLDNITEQGLYRHVYGSDPSNTPTALTYIMEVLNYDNSQVIQKAIDTQANLYIRMRHNGTWSAWVNMNN